MKKLLIQSSIINNLFVVDIIKFSEVIYLLFTSLKSALKKESDMRRISERKRQELFTLTRSPREIKEQVSTNEIIAQTQATISLVESCSSISILYDMEIHPVTTKTNLTN